VGTVDERVAEANLEKEKAEARQLVAEHDALDARQSMTEHRQTTSLIS